MRAAFRIVSAIADALSVSKQVRDESNFGTIASIRCDTSLLISFAVASKIARCASSSSLTTMSPSRPTEYNPNPAESNATFSGASVRTKRATQDRCAGHPPASMRACVWCQYSRRKWPALGSEALEADVLFVCDCASAAEEGCLEGCAGKRKPGPCLHATCTNAIDVTMHITTRTIIRCRDHRLNHPPLPACRSTSSLYPWRSWRLSITSAHTTVYKPRWQDMLHPVFANTVDGERVSLCVLVFLVFFFWCFVLRFRIYKWWETYRRKFKKQNCFQLRRKYVVFRCNAPLALRVPLPIASLCKIVPLDLCKPQPDASDTFTLETICDQHVYTWNDSRLTSLPNRKTASTSIRSFTLSELVYDDIFVCARIDEMR